MSTVMRAQRGLRGVPRLHWLDRRPSGAGDGGFTLVEVMVAGAVMVALAAGLGSTLISNLQATGAVERRSRGVDELRIGVARLEKEFRYAECVHQPVVTAPGGTASGAILRFDTRLNSGIYEVTYRVENGNLYRNRGTGDEIVATELIGAATTFTIEDAARRRLDLRLSVQPGGQEVHVLETSVTGRNAWRDC